MLAGILLTDFAIAKKVELSFDSNLVIISGETGTGKTILMRALTAACGGDATSNLIRAGSNKAQVEVSFMLDSASKGIDVLKKLSLFEGEPIVILSRVIDKNRTKGIINGHPVPIKSLMELGSSLIDMHGQHEVQSLLNSSTHILSLDRFGGESLISLKEKVISEIAAYRRISKDLNDLVEQDKRYREERDFINFEVEELEKAELQEEEEEELIKEEKILSNAQELVNLIDESRTSISGEENRSILDLAELVSANLKRASVIDSALSSLNEQIESISVQLKELDRDLARYDGAIVFDADRLSFIEERLSLLSALKLKYKKTVPELINYLSELEERLQSFTSLEEKIEELSKQKEEFLSKIKIDVSELSLMRNETASRFQKEVLNELKDLAMGNVDFKVSFKNVADENGIEIDGKIVKLFPDGIDLVEFLIAPNPGEGAKPLASIASGGELSRVTLAIKKVLAEVDEIPVLIFDEVDAGIGGKTGEKVAEKLREIAKYRQVICITHLPQIASLPGEHFVVEKKIEDGKTFLKARKLEECERVNEIARMISGTNVTTTTISQAKELIGRWQ